MNPKLTQSILLATALSGVVLVLAAYALWGTTAAVGAFVGSAIAVANAAAMKFLVAMGTQPSGDAKHMRGRLVVMLFLKVAILMLVCWLCITKWGVSFDGFILGFGAMVLGILIGSKLAPPPAMPATATGGEAEV